MAKGSAIVHSSGNRRRLGQVFTPRPVADWMVRWACENSPRRVLEPAVGEGVFIEALESRYVRSRKRPAVVAYEVDDRMIAAGRERSSSLEVEHRHESFLESTSADRYDAVVANPPYVRHHEHRLDEAVFERFDRSCRRRLSRLTNLYGLFLVRIWESLAHGGRAAVITPAEWLNADFGKAMKAYLLEENAIDGIVHFGHGSKVFSDAMTTAAISLLRKGRDANEGVRFTTVNGAEELSDDLLGSAPIVSQSGLDPTQKWTPLFDGSAGSNVRAVSRGGTKGGATLGDVARCVRGIATGANQYFTLRESDRCKFGIEMEDLSPCITKAQQVIGEVFESKHFQTLLADDQRVLLLNPRERLSAAVERYLAHGKALGIHERYLPAHRPTWFRPEARPAAPIWVSVFARGRFRFIRNRLGALSLTAYHAIYPHLTDAGAVESLVAYLQSDAAQEALRDHRRIYAEGLLKLEPRDVEAIPIPESVAARFSGAR